MKKNFVFVMMCVVSLFAAETAIFFAYNCNKLNNQKKILMKSICELNRENYDLRVILDSIDNPHHHDYLLTLESYRSFQSLQK